jgi:hypothetical protein
VWSLWTPHSVTCQEKKAPNYCVLPVTGGHCGPNGKRASFFPVIFQSFESLPVVTDGRTDGHINTYVFWVFFFITPTVGVIKKRQKNELGAFVFTI